MLNALASALTQEMVEKIIPVASKIFFESGKEDGLYQKADVYSLIANDFSKELTTRPSSFTGLEIKSILINTPAFLAKSDQRLTFSSRITLVAEATKVAWRHALSANNLSVGGVAGVGGAAGLGGTAGASQFGLPVGLSPSGSGGATLTSMGTAGIAGPIGLSGAPVFGSLGPTGPSGPSGTGMWGGSPHLSNPSSPPPVLVQIRRRGEHVFEVIWSAILTAGGALRNPKVERIEFKGSDWEEEP